jgi:hypothetical protein
MDRLIRGAALYSPKRVFLGKGHFAVRLLQEFGKIQMMHQNPDARDQYLWDFGKNV